MLPSKTASTPMPLKQPETENVNQIQVIYTMPALRVPAQWLVRLVMQAITPKIKTNKQETKQQVDEFCRRWIPQLYGISANHPQYREACLRELTRWLEGCGEGVNFSYIKTHWYWEAESAGEVPDKLLIVVSAATLSYTILEKFGVKIRYPLP